MPPTPRFKIDSEPPHGSSPFQGESGDNKLHEQTGLFRTFASLSETLLKDGGFIHMKLDTKKAALMAIHHRANLIIVLTCLSFLIMQSPAHEGASASHEHATDTRDTPRDADSHVTGQLLRAHGENTTSKSKIRFVIHDNHRIVTANGIPNHDMGRFPNKGNPNVISAQSYTFRIPLDPMPPSEPVLTTDRIHRDNGFLFGVALNGVPFEPATGMNWTPDGIRRGGRPGDWVYEAIGGSINFGIDHANAHIQRTGAYHYHGIPTPIISDKQPTLVGYAADGCA